MRIVPTVPILAGLLLVSCSAVDNPVATSIGTDGHTPRRYHYLAEHPFGDGLLHRGFVVAIEKAPKLKAGEGAWKGRLRSAESVDPAVRQKFAEVMGGKKAMVVTHLLVYEPDPTGPRMRSRFLYNLYPDAGAEVFASTAVGVTYEEQGWRVLEQVLLPAVKEELAKPRGTPYTHLLIGAMGWDNDQVECLRRFNAVIDHARAAAQRAGEADTFNPLFVGITWPSVWGWHSVFGLGEFAYKILSYGNKANDADEIGFGIANWLVNRLGANAKASHDGLKLVVFGHSFGARLTSRAVFSRVFLQDAPTKSPVDLYVGLHGAFSVHRFMPNAGNEGSPYADVLEETRNGLHVVLTASRKDTANPAARFLSRSPHVGGGPGLDVALRDTTGRFDVVVPDQDGTLRPGADAKKVTYVDATEIVHDHSDVLNKEVGRLVWSAIRAFAPARP